MLRTRRFEVTVRLYLDIIDLVHISRKHHRKELDVIDLEKPTGTSEGAARIRLLVVDDETELLESLSRVLSRRGMIVSTASSAAAALEFLGTQQVDVAIVDIKMPEMNGMELLECLKRRYPRLEVIVLTGHPSIDTVLESTLIGAYEYTRKPPDIDELTRLIGRAFERQRQRREAERQTELRNARNHSAYM